MGEDTDDMVTSTSKLRDLVKGITGFDIMESETEFKDIYDIIMGIGAEWNNINDIDKAALLEALAGKRQANALAATLQNTEMLAEAYETAENSAGSAMREQKNFEKGIQYSLDRIKATGQTALMDIIGSGPVKGIVDTGNVLLSVLDKIIDKTGLLGPALAAGMSIFTRRSGHGLLTYDQFNNQLGGLLPNMVRGGKEAKQEGGTFIGGALQTFTGRRGKRAASNAYYTNLFEQITGTGQYKGNQRDASTISFDDAEKAAGGIDKLDVAHKNLREDVEKSNITQAEFYSQVAAGKQATMPMADALKSFGKSMLTNVGQMGIMMAASWALSAAIEAISKKTITFSEASQSTRALVDEFKDANDAASDNKKTIDDLQDEYFKLRKGVDATTNTNLSLSNEDYERFLDISNQIADIYPHLASGHDANGNAILAEVKNVEALADAYKKVQKEASLALINEEGENGKNFDVFAQSYLNGTTQTQATNATAGVFSRIHGNLQQMAHALTGKYEVGIDTSAINMLNSTSKALRDPTKLLSDYNAQIKELGEGTNLLGSQMASGKSLSNMGYDAVQAFTDLCGVLDVSQEELQEILSDSSKFSEYSSDIQAAYDSASVSIEEATGNAREYIDAFVKSKDVYYSLDEDKQNMLNGLLGGLSQEAITNLMYKSMDEFGKIDTTKLKTSVSAFSNNLIRDINNGGVYQNIKSVQSLLSADNLNMSGIATIVQTLKGLDGEVAGLSSLDLSDAFGATDAINTTIDFSHAIGDLTGDVESLQDDFYNFDISEMNAFLGVFNDMTNAGVTDATQIYEAYKNALVEMRHAQGEIGAHTFQDDLGAGSQFAAVQATQDQEYKDFGDTYSSMKTMLDRAKELKKSGFTGTDEFKSIATMFDAYGRSDVDAFSDNLDTLNKYFKDTENIGGAVNNFLDDLTKTENDAGEAMATLDDATGDYILNLGDLKYAAEQLGIGYEPLVAMLDMAQGQGAIFEHFDNVEDGYQRVGELQGEYYAELAKLDTMENHTDEFSDDAIDAQKQKVEELKLQWDTAQEAVDNYRDSVKESMEFDNEYTTGLATETQNLAKEAQTQTGMERTESQHAVLVMRDELQSKVNNLALEWGSDFNIDNFGTLKQEIIDANTEMEKLFGNTDHEIKYSFTGEELEELNGEQSAEMNVTTSVANIFASAIDAGDLLNGNTNLDSSSDRGDYQSGHRQANQSGGSDDNVYTANKNYEPKSNYAFGSKISDANGVPVLYRDKGTSFHSEPTRGSIIEDKAKYERRQYGGYIGVVDPQTGNQFMQRDSGQSLLQILKNWAMNSQTKSQSNPTANQPQTQGAFQNWWKNRQPTGVINPATNAPIGQPPNGQEYNAKFGVDSSEADGKLLELTEKGKEWAKSVFKSLLQADDQASEPIDSAATQAYALDGFTAMIHALAQDHANPVLQALDEFLQGLDGNNATVEADAEDNATPILDFIREVVLSLQGEDATVDLNATDGVSPIVQQILGLIANIGGTDIPLTADSSEGVAAADELSGAIDGIQPKTVAITAITSGLEAVQSLRSAIAGVVGKSVRVVTNFVTKHTKEPAYTGTVGGFSRGTIGAFASGSKVSIDKDQDAIVNELGEEGLIRDGVMHRITGGMQQIHLKKGDIVVNHKQMEELEKGEVRSNGGRGRLIGAFAHGTLDGANAYALGDKITNAIRGVGNAGRWNPTKSRGSKSSSKSTKSNTKATNDNTSATESNTDAKDEEKSAAEELKEQFDKLYDWVETFISRTEKVMDNLETKAENTTKYWSTRNSYLQQEMDIAKSFYSDLSASYNKYIAQANASGLSSEYKTKVQQGRKNEIEEIETDSELRARIDEYEKW